MVTEFLDLKLLAGTILPNPAPVILDEKSMDEWEKFRKLLRGEGEGEKQ